MQWVHLPQCQPQYHVPTDWTPVRQTPDRTLIVTCFNPCLTLRFTAGKVRNAAVHTTPAQALEQLARQYGLAAPPPMKATCDNLHFLETIGTGRLDGQPQRYQARASKSVGQWG